MDIKKTTCFKAIKKASGMNPSAVEGLYDISGYRQPMKVEVAPSSNPHPASRFSGREITGAEMAANVDWYSRRKTVVEPDFITIEVLPGIIVTSVAEDIK